MLKGPQKSWSLSYQNTSATLLEIKSRSTASARDSQHTDKHLGLIMTLQQKQKVMIIMIGGPPVTGTPVGSRTVLECSYNTGLSPNSGCYCMTVTMAFWDLLARRDSRREVLHPHSQEHSIQRLYFDAPRKCFLKIVKLTHFLQERRQSFQSRMQSVQSAIDITAFCTKDVSV